MKCVKRMAGICAALALTLSMTMGVFAAPSPSAEGIVINGQGTDADGNAVDIIVQEISTESDETAQKAKEEIQKKENLVAVLEKILASDSENTENNEVVKEALEKVKEGTADIADLKEVIAPEGTVFPVSITFDVNGVTDGSKVVILHFNGTEWENIPVDAVADGKVTATFDSLSPVAFILEKDAATSVAGTTSPKTGASTATMMAAFGAVICIAGMVVLSKRKSA